MKTSQLKRYRELTGKGFAEAKAFLESIPEDAIEIVIQQLQQVAVDNTIKGMRMYFHASSYSERDEKVLNALFHLVKDNPSGLDNETFNDRYQAIVKELD